MIFEENSTVRKVNNVTTYFSDICGTIKTIFDQNDLQASGRTLWQETSLLEDSIFSVYSN